MDFKFTADQENLRALAHKALADARPNGPKDPWQELARAGLCGIAVPAEHGGAGLGFVELCLLCEEAGRAASTASLVPALASVGLTLSRCGTAEQQARLLPSLASGEQTLTAALYESGNEPLRPATRARPEGGGWRLDGSKTCVPALSTAARVLVSARVDDGALGLFLVDPRAEGVRRERQLGTDDAALDLVSFAGVRVDDADVVPGGAAALAQLLAYTDIAWCAVELGIAERQVAMTAEYVLRRQQFGKPIGTFQAVAQRAADAYIDVDAMRLTLWQAAWRLAEGLPAAHEIAAAKFWAADGGQRVAAAAQHLHGGIGFDRAYPLYRYFLGAKTIELTLGGASRQLAELGALLAAE